MEMEPSFGYGNLRQEQRKIGALALSLLLAAAYDVSVS
jgi:hypothetical protein